MAETDTKVAGKTGDELRSAVLQQQAEATDRTELPEEKKVQAIQKEVKPEETLDPLTYTVPETKVSEAKEIDTDKFVGTQPVVPEVKGYEATKVGDVGKVKVKKGDFVTEGDIIGKMGSTGRAVGAHLHYEIKVNKKSVNPYNFISIGRELLSSSIIRK